MEKPHVIDHIGWELWTATAKWKRDLVAGMRARGFHDYAEARYGLLRHIGPNGLAQSELTSKAGLTKQAVQQQVDDLVQDGVIVRTPYPNDARKKTIVLTSDGQRLFSQLNEVKVEIELRYEKHIGQEKMACLKEALEAINSLQELG